MTTQMAELTHQIQTEHEQLRAMQDRLRSDVEALHLDIVTQCLRAGLPPHTHSAEHLADRVLALRSMLATSERLRKMEAQAVALAIKSPDGPPRVPGDLICALRGYTLPEDFLPSVEWICAENERLRDVIGCIGVEKIDGGWKFMINSVIGVGSTARDAVEAAIVGEVDRRLAAARLAVEEIGTVAHAIACRIDSPMGGVCDCDVQEALTVARRAVGLEPQAVPSSQGGEVSNG